MPIKVVVARSTVRVLIDEEVPVDALKAPPEKLGMFEKADRDWGVKKEPPPRPLGELDRHSYGIIKTSALRYVKALIEEEIRALEGLL